MQLSRRENIAVTDSSGSTHQVVTSTGLLRSNDYDLNLKAPLGGLEIGSTAANLSAHGISSIPYSTVANVLTLDAPVYGVEKDIYMNSTAVTDTTAITTMVHTGSTAIFIRDNSTAYAKKLYASFQPPYAHLKLLGLSTAEWGVISTYGAVQFTTAVGYTT